jgi:hypothetical protein
MTVENINGEIIIRIPSSIDIEEVQRVIDLVAYREATAQTEASQEDIDCIAIEVKKGWWATNRHRFISQ